MIIWIRLPRLPQGLYTKSLLKFIGRAIGPFAKIDRKTNNDIRGQFVRLAIYIDLGKPLVSKVNINGKIQCMEYELLPLICFYCGRFGHNRNSCLHKFR